MTVDINYYQTREGYSDASINRPVKATDVGITQKAVSLFKASDFVTTHIFLTLHIHSTFAYIACITFTVIIFPLQEFVVGLSVLSRGTFQERLQWAFSLYDVNGDGIITKEEMLDIVTAIYEMMGRYTEPSIDDTTAREHVERVFQVGPPLIILKSQ